MRLKLAERARLLAQVEDVEASADAAAARVAEIEEALANRLGEVTATQQALTEVIVRLETCMYMCVPLLTEGGE